MPDLKISYKGKVYTFRGTKWCDENGYTVPVGISLEINRYFFDNTDFSNYSIDDLLVMGDAFKSTESNRLSMKCFYAATELALKAEDYNKVGYILPRATSLYRQMKKPEDAIELFRVVKEQYGEALFNHACLTSIAGAYLDIGKKREAEICLKRAIKLNGGKTNNYIEQTYDRLRGHPDSDNTKYFNDR